MKTNKQKKRPINKIKKYEKDLNTLLYHSAITCILQK